MRSSGSRGPVYVRLYHQRSQVQSPLLPRLHRFWCGQYFDCSCAFKNVTLHILTPLCLYPCTQNLAYEIILTLGQAFEVAYQLALQARKSGHGSSTLPESFDSKPNKPVPKPRVNIRKSVSITGAQTHHGLKGGSILNTSNLALFSDAAMIWILYAWQLLSDLDVLSNMFMMNSPFDTQHFQLLNSVTSYQTHPISHHLHPTALFSLGVWSSLDYVVVNSPALE